MSINLSSVIAPRNRIHKAFIATEGQTVFTLTHNSGEVDVYLNGTKLVLNSDYTSNGLSITLTVPSVAGDSVEVVSYSPFSVSSAYTKAESDLLIDQHEAATDPHPQYETSTEAQAKVDTHNALTGTSVHGLGTAATANVTTSANDTTAGRLLKVGDFGIGSMDGNFYPSNDLNAFVATGFYKTFTDTLNVPSGATYTMGSTVLNQNWDLNSGQQTYFTHLTGEIFHRFRSNDGEWGPWREIYHQGSILGTVSQSSGVPTGAIIERGSNASGEYVKFADGTMICNINTGATLSVTINFSGGYISPAIEHVFPASFSSSPYCSVWGRGDSNLTWPVANYSVNTIISFFFVGITTSTASTAYQITAIGRWF